MLLACQPGAEADGALDRLVLFHSNFNPGPDVFWGADKASAFGRCYIDTLEGLL